jgi:hypothetical protein
MNKYVYTTTLNGGIITVVLNIHTEQNEDGWNTTTSFQAVYFDCTDVTGILSKETINELEMEAEKGFTESAWEQANGY